MLENPFWGSWYLGGEDTCSHSISRHRKSFLKFSRSRRRNTCSYSILRILSVSSILVQSPTLLPAACIKGDVRGIPLSHEAWTEWDSNSSRETVLLLLLSTSACLGMEPLRLSRWISLYLILLLHITLVNRMEAWCPSCLPEADT